EQVHAPRRTGGHRTPGEDGARRSLGQAADLGGPRVRRRGGEGAERAGGESAPERKARIDRCRREGDEGEHATVRGDLDRVARATLLDDVTCSRRLLLASKPRERDRE